VEEPESTVGLGVEGDDALGVAEVAVVGSVATEGFSSLYRIQPAVATGWLKAEASVRLRAPLPWSRRLGDLATALEFASK